MAHIAKEHPVYFLMLEGLDWAEIDDPAQLARAQKVWEKIKPNRS
jgi:choline kinase